MKRIIALILVFALCLSLCACGGGGSPKKNTCKSCGRSFQAGDSAGNFRKIASSGMCNNCYNNFKSMTNALGK